MLSKCLSAALAAVVTMSQAEAAAPADRPSTPAATVSLRPTPLPAAGAAPIREAQGVGRPLLYWAAGGVAIITAVLLIHQDDDETSTTATVSTGN